MALLKIKVPNGQKCNGCSFLRKESKNTHYNEWTDYYTCAIFNQAINQDKCIACLQMCEEDAMQ